MKTAMQKHIIYMKKVQAMVELLNVGKDLKEAIFESIEGCIINAESSLEAEKEQIIEAYRNGFKDAQRPFRPTESYTTFEQYYQQTFKSDE